MKQAILLILFSLMVQLRSLQIQITTPAILVDQITLHSLNAFGKVKYQTQNLPKGLILTENKIQITDRTYLAQGQYVVLIRATDQKRNSDEKQFIFILTFSKQTITEKQYEEAKYKQNVYNLPFKKSMHLKKNIGFQPRILTQKISQTSVLTKPLPANQTQTVNKQNGKDFKQKVDSNLQIYNVRQIINIVEKNKPSQNSVINQTKNKNIYDQISSNSVQAPTNIVPQIIAQNKASTSSVPKISTQATIKSELAFKRQASATKAIANLFAIIKQANAKRNKTMDEMKNLQSLYNISLQSRLRINITLTKLYLDFNNSQTTLNQTKQQKISLQKTLDSLTKQLQTKKQKQQQTISLIYRNQDKLNNLVKQVDKIKKQYEELDNKRGIKKQKCQKLQQQLSAIFQKRQAKMDELVNAKVLLLPAKAKLEIDKRYYQQLKQQIKLAQQRVKQSQLFVQYYTSQQIIHTNDLQIIQRKLYQSKNYTYFCSQELQAINQQISNVTQNKLYQLLNNKNIQQNQIKQQAGLLAQLNIDISKLPNTIKEIKQKIDKSSQSIMNISKYLNDVQSQIMDFKAMLIDANNYVDKNKTKLYEAQRNYLKLGMILQKANKNIELARAQKQAADIQVSVRMRQSSANLLPFVSTPPDLQVTRIPEKDNNTQQSNYSNSSNSSINKIQKIQKDLTNISKITTVQNITNITNINNQVISKIQQTKNKVKEQTQLLLASGGLKTLVPNSDGTYSIKNIHQFVLVFFGPTVKSPSLDISIIYPITQQLKQTNITLSTTAIFQQKSLNGYIISVQQCSFRILVQNSGLVYEIQYSGNIRGFIAYADVRIKVGNKAIVKGINYNTESMRYILANLIFCFN